MAGTQGQDATRARTRAGSGAAGTRRPGGSQAPSGGEDPAVLPGYYRQMALARAFELRAAEMYTRAKIGGYCHLNLGEEATVVGLMAALRADDYLFTTYREHGYALARGADPGRVMTPPAPPWSGPAASTSRCCWKRSATGCAATRWSTPPGTGLPKMPNGCAAATRCPRSAPASWPAEPSPRTPRPRIDAEAGKAVTAEVDYADASSSATSSRPPEPLPDHRHADGDLHRALQRAVRPFTTAGCCLPLKVVTPQQFQAYMAAQQAAQSSSGSTQ